MANQEQHYDIRELAAKWKDGTITAEEKAYYEKWYRQFNDELTELSGTSSASREELEQHIYAGLEQRIGLVQTGRVRRLWPRIAAAASILIALSAGGYFLLHKKQVPQQLARNELIVPGSRKAVLILANGQQISLSDARAGKLAQQGNAAINKSSNGQIVYNNTSSSPSEAIIYNIIVTPRGGYYPLQMADGTIAILDAGSSIKYPVNFRDGQDRLVEITGQVYFEVKHNSRQPFKLKAKGQTIEDIGTVFNVNAYDDEPAIRTTLVDGSIKVQNIILKPGQQTDGTNISKVNIDDVIAWKNGQTSFEGETVQEIMRQVSRWYDVDIEYEGALPQRKFTGGIPRNATFSNLLKALEFDDIHVTLQGKKLIIRP